MVSVGTIVWLSSELMFFAALFAMFFSIRAATPRILWAANTEHLNVAYALPFTIILVASSITCQIGVFRAEKGDVFALRRWYSLTFVMGLIFVLGQANEYRMLVEEGIKINTDGFGSMFFLTTGFHGLHVCGGLLAFIIYMIRTTMGRFTPAQATAAIVVSYYWHFVDIVWIALFAMIYLLPHLSY
jgi:cytochrome c oxidase subunit III